MPGQTKDEMEDPATVQRLLAQYVDVDKVEVLGELVYTFNALVAERWRDGRVLLAGDAAHMTPQFMGQGMSSGVRDAHNLAWKLEAVLRKGADPKLIDTYQSERKPHAKEMIDISVKMKDFVSLANPVLAATRNVVVRTLLDDAESRRLHSRRRASSRRRPIRTATISGSREVDGTAPKGGPFPQPQVRTYDGRRTLLDELLGEDYALVGYACDPRASLDARTVARLRALGARFVALYPFGGRPQGGAVNRGAAAGALTEVEDLGGEGIAWFRGAGARKGHVALVRPDKFVYALTPATQLAAVVNRALEVYGDAAPRPGAVEPAVAKAGEKAGLAA